MLDTSAETKHDNVFIDDPNWEGALKTNTTPCLSLSLRCAIDPTRNDGVFAMEERVEKMALKKPGVTLLSLSTKIVLVGE